MRQFRGWGWLAKRADRAAVVRYVRGDPGAAAAWDAGDPDADRIERDRRILSLLGGGMSLRAAAEQVGKSYGFVGNCKDVYGAGVRRLPKPVARAAKSPPSEAGRKLTATDVRRYLGGRLSIGDIAARIGTSKEAARLWLRRAAERKGIPWPKRKGKSAG